MSLRSSRSAAVLLASVALAACGDRRLLPMPAALIALTLTSLPAEASALIHVDVPRLAASSVIRDAVGSVLARDVASAERLKAFLARCSIDPVRDITRLRIVLGPHPAAGAIQDAALVVDGRFDEQRLEACAGGLAHEARHGFRVQRTADDAAPVWLTFSMPGQLVVATSAAWLDRFLDPGAARLGTGAPLGSRLMHPPTAMIWGVGLLPPGVGDRVVSLTEGDVLAPATAVRFEADAADDLRLRVALEMASATDAEKLVAFARDQKGWLVIIAQRYGAQDVINRIEMSAAGREAVLEARLDPPLLEQVAALLARGDRD